MDSAVVEFCRGQGEGRCSGVGVSGGGMLWGRDAVRAVLPDVWKTKGFWGLGHAKQTLRRLRLSSPAAMFAMEAQAWPFCSIPGASE